VNGKRTSLPEIERAVEAVLNRGCCSILFKDRVVVFVADENAEAEDFVIRCSEKLPKHLVPSKFVKVSNFPVTANGKIDRKSLEAILLEKSKRKRLDGRNRNEIFFDLWQKLVSIPPKGSDCFAELGGDSHLVPML
jgi:nonribosomal peptide synthetase DhbF